MTTDNIRKFILASTHYSRLLGVCFLLFVITFAHVIGKSQNLTPVQWKSIAQNSDYIIGQGTDSDLEKARQSALSSLVSSISVNVSSQFSSISSEKSSGSNIDSEEKVNMIIQSYSSAVLNNVDEYIEQKKGIFTVYKYLKRNDLQAMFKKRVALARKWIWEARRSYKEGKTGDALRDYYWALLLLRSCPEADLEVFEDENGEHNMMQYAFGAIKDILSMINVEATECHTKDGIQFVTLKFTHGDEPLTNFNYRYFDGNNTSEIHTVKDGIGEIVLSESLNLSNVKILAEYECRDEANINTDLCSVIQSTDPVPLQAAQLKIDAKNCKAKDTSDDVRQVSQSTPTTSVFNASTDQNNKPSLTFHASEITMGNAEDSYFRSKRMNADETVQKVKSANAANTSSNTLSLGFGIWEGDVKNGKPDGIGKITFTTAHLVDRSTTYTANPGDYFMATYDNGSLISGKLYDKEGNLLKTIIP